MQILKVLETQTKEMVLKKSYVCIFVRVEVHLCQLSSLPYILSICIHQKV